MAFIVYLLVCYGILNLFIYYILAPVMMYQPPRASYKDSESIIKLTTAHGTQISAVYLQQPGAEYTILFSHGNAEDLGYVSPFIKQYLQYGFSVLAYDYHGYGTSQGFASEANTYADIEAAYKYLITKTTPDKIIALGRSLGTGPTIHLAANYQVAGVVLESPFQTAFRIITRIPLFPVDRYRNTAIINKVTVPILIIHGTRDEVVPFSQGKQLFELIQQENKHFIAVDGAMHNDMVSKMGEQYFQQLQAFANTLQSKPKGIIHDGA